MQLDPERLSGLARRSQGVIEGGLQVRRAIQREPLTCNLLAEAAPQPAIDQAVQEALEGGSQGLGRAEKLAVILLQVSADHQRRSLSSPSTHRGHQERKKGGELQAGE